MNTYRNFFRNASSIRPEMCLCIFFYGNASWNVVKNSSRKSYRDYFRCSSILVSPLEMTPGIHPGTAPQKFLKIACRDSSRSVSRDFSRNTSGNACRDSSKHAFRNICRNFSTEILLGIIPEFSSWIRLRVSL